ncbi:TIGR04338 family metallohydrolase [Aldersonia sp. NBC_00410]|uniref:TIGR04338 family metallohydrolase n=1 Tax=Aldersonia sp. NBC_00410 TaxID=2975954 RepID=UPI002253E774|nr:TIGR04338 family metallohydrolase [Aldersonia sp. NBC_00410]MCX5044937.1 TIGR04338 family metallohydrolase [Aldersonia sp. NBC_00410]
MSPARDTQRAKVYEADQFVRTVFERADEHGLRAIEVLGSQVTLPIERRFASIESVQTYADKVLGLNWIRDRWPRATEPVRIRARAGTAAAHYEFATATLAVPLHTRNTAWALREFVVLHELAHHLDPDPDHPAHGPEFCSRYLELVDGVIGPEAALLLRATLADCGARVG